MNVPRPRLVDAHCHLDLFPDMEEVMSRADATRVATVAVTTTPRAWPRNLELSERFPHIYPALGLHPQLVSLEKDGLELWERYCSAARYIGEVGLDASPSHYASFQEQQHVFSHILRTCSRLGDKVITVHSVRSVKQVLDSLERNLGNGCVPVLHWFTGTVADARRAIELGCYFSVNAQTASDPRHTFMLRSLPTDRLLTETDGPFTSLDGRPSEPCDVGSAVSGLARAREVDATILREAIVSNFVSLASENA